MLALPLLAFGAAALEPSASTILVTVTATPTSGLVPLTVAFTATVSAGPPTTVAWTFGDGSSWSGSGSAALSVTHRYISVGTYVATASVSTPTGSGSGAATVGVASGPVVAAISATPGGGNAPLTVVFRAVVSGGTGTYPVFDWNFGDSSIGLGPVVQHTYRSAGRFSVSLAVVDSANATTATAFDLDVSSATSVATGSTGWSVAAPATLAAVGIVGAGLTWGIYYRGRRRRSSRPDLDEDLDGTGALPPGVFGPAAGALPSPAAAAASSSSEASIAASSESAAPPAESVYPSPGRSGPASSIVPSSVLRSIPTARSPPAEPRRWSRDLVAYLGGLPTLGPDDIPTLAWTQKGMSDRLGTGQNQVSNVLRRLVSAGLVVEELQHVQSQPRRLKVYRLSMRGEALARELRRRRPPTNPNFLKSDW